VKPYGRADELGHQSKLRASGRSGERIYRYAYSLAG
jgi:hypothetical protein